MDLLKAISLSLGELEEPVVTHYRLGLILHELYAHRRYQKEKLAIKNEQATSVELNAQVAKLVNAGVLKPHPNFNGTVYQFSVERWITRRRWCAVWTRSVMFPI